MGLSLYYAFNYSSSQTGKVMYVLGYKMIKLKELWIYAARAHNEYKNDRVGAGSAQAKACFWYMFPRWMRYYY